ncbi:MAG TPA: hypothetical protein ENJ86_07355 [Methylothermaceae bacterium]|nr:hypothetical protein [Methylothermaceae bacterium]
MDSKLPEGCATGEVYTLIKHFGFADDVVFQLRDFMLQVIGHRQINLDILAHVDRKKYRALVCKSTLKKY